VTVISPERRYAEDAAVVLESLGMPRSYGKLLAWLLVCDPPQQSSTEMAGALDLSAGSVSTGLRLLVNSGLVRRVAVPGKRGKVYELADNAMVLASQDDRVRIFRELMERGIEVVGGENPERSRRLRQTRDFYAFMEREVPGLVQRFITEQGS
jgi:DNA-binding transcriptional regulator GbsR (MarR family)